MNTLNDCRKGDHTFIKVYEHGGDMDSTVVRWCECCGSIVVDLDYDGRTNPGSIMKLRTPIVAKEIRNKND